MLILMIAVIALIGTIGLKDERLAREMAGRTDLQHAFDAEKQLNAQLAQGLRIMTKNLADTQAALKTAQGKVDEQSGELTRTQGLLTACQADARQKDAKL